MSGFWTSPVFERPYFGHPLYFAVFVFRPLTLGAYKHETDFEERRNKMMEKIETARSQVQVRKKLLSHLTKMTFNMKNSGMPKFRKCQNLDANKTSFHTIVAV